MTVQSPPKPATDRPPRRLRRWRRRLVVLAALATLAGAVAGWYVWRTGAGPGRHRTDWRGSEGEYLNTTDYHPDGTHDDAR